MKLATLQNGRPDGQLVVVSRDLKRCVSAGRIAANMIAALDDWDKLAPKLQALSEDLNKGQIASQPFEPSLARAPLPRAFQWIDGAGYLGHLERVRVLKGSKDAGLETRSPMVYQGGSDSLLGPSDPIVVPEENLALDFEAEIAVITGPVPMGASPEVAAGAVRLVGLCNDISLRRLVAGDLEDGFGFFHSKPSTSFAPVVATPDELGAQWRESRLYARCEIDVNEIPYGRLMSGTEMHFSFADIIAAAARTRPLGGGTIIGSGTIANTHEKVLPIRRDDHGFGCIAEARSAEKAKFGKARTPFLQAGDRLRIEALDEAGHSLFGVMRQTVQLLEITH